MEHIYSEFGGWAKGIYDKLIILREVNGGKTQRQCGMK